jgi:TetR/AcrR family transcriptional repressor of nem operon
LAPLERIRRYCEFEYGEQVELKRKHGFALGCPLFTLGTEISTLEAGLRKKVNEIMDQSRSYFESAIRDAHARGAIKSPDPSATARSVHTYVEGMLTQARIQDDVELLKDLERGILDILGVPSPALT